MEFKEELIPGKYYHIFNCGINGEDLFRDHKDYERFLKLYEIFIEPVCETFAWVLMKNHFHFLVRIKENLVYKYSMKDAGFDKEKFKEIKWETTNLTCQRPQDLTALNSRKDMTALNCRKDLTALKPKPHLHFSHFFNAYAKYYNIRHERHGSLFERPFNRKEIDNSRYFQNVVVYIHQNPVHHGFCEHPMEYGWSSYLTLISFEPTSVKRDNVIGWFDSIANFKTVHNKILNRGEIESYLGL